MSRGSEGRPHPVVLLLVAGVALGAQGSLGCYRIPEGQSAISKVTIEGLDDETVDRDEVAERILTRESPRFLGLFDGVVYEYEIFDRYALRRDLQRIERYLRARGYYEAKVRASRVEQRDNKVRVTIEVDEGQPVVVDTVSLEGDGAFDDRKRRRVTRSVAQILPHGAPLDEDKFVEAEKAVLTSMTNQGHASAKVTRHAEVDLATHTARLRFSVEPGPVVQLGEIRFVGLGEIPEDKVRHLFGLKKGDVYSSEDLDEAKQALLDLGVFASVEVEPDLSQIEATKTVPLTIRTEPSKLRAFLGGAGFEFDSLRTDVHGMVGWQNMNLLGGLRKFEVRFKPGLVLYPTPFPRIEAPDKILFEQRLTATLRQPAFVESRTTGLARSEYAVYPVLLPNSGDANKNVVGYHEVRGAVGLERSFFTKHVFVSPQYALQANFPFNYLGRTEDIPTLLLSYVDVLTFLDLRDDPNHTRKGAYFGLQFQFAGGPLQGDATDLRVQPEVRGYLPLTKRIVLAARTSVGFLFPQSYGDAADDAFHGRQASSTSDLNRDYQIFYFRGFFAGGPSSNRGYPLRGIGPYAQIPYLSPVGQSSGAGGCNPTDPSCRLPTGGLSLWEANLEVRIAIAGPFSTALFADAADVSPFLTDIRIDRPHLSVGAGARYDTPVGPIRLDLGYRVPGLQVPSGVTPEIDPNDLPLALSFGIGESF